MSAFKLDQLIIDLARPERMSAYASDPESYLTRYDLPREEAQLVLGLDWNGLLDAGVSIYILTRLAEAHGFTLFDLGAAMRGTDRAGLNAFLADQNARNAPKALLAESDGSDG
jgi:hypothetical protein